MKVKAKVKLLSHVWLLRTPWTAAYQAPPSMGFSRQEYWSGVPLVLRKLQITTPERSMYTLTGMVTMKKPTTPRVGEAGEQLDSRCWCGCKLLQPLHKDNLMFPKRDQPWGFFGKSDAKAETPVLWPPHAKSWLIGKYSDAERDWGQEKGTTEDEMAGWHHWLDGRESEWTPGVSDQQGGLACCDSWGLKELDTTERLNWTEIVNLWE